MTAVTSTTSGVNTNATTFRAWGSDINTQLKAAGLTQTSDTGQISWTTVSAPGAINTSMGYEIYRFNDTLQGTYPVYIKTEYGSGTNAVFPSIWITVGTITDGAGNLSGQVSNRTQLNASSSTSLKCIYSGDSNRICFGLWVNPAAGNETIFVSIERSHDASGNDTSDGILTLFCNSNGPNAYTQYVPFSGTVGTQYSYWNATLPPSGSGANGNNVTMYPIRGWNSNGETSPSLNFFNYFTIDITAGTTITATFWDSNSHTAYANTITNVSLTKNYLGSPANTPGLMMRYD